MGESKAELAKLYGVGRSTLYRALEKEWQQAKEY
jgi:DNA-binding XRE family transcriptional regulator